MTIDAVRLAPDCDVTEVARLIWTALARQRQQLHQGRRCVATRSPLLRDGESRHCLVCDELALDAQERVIAAWQRQADRTPWTPARIATCAQSVLADRIRTRLSVTGLVARPERWIDQRSFLPEQPAAGRVLVVALVVSAGYFTCIPTSGDRVLVSREVVEPLVEGVRRGSFAGALTRAWPSAPAEVTPEAAVGLLTDALAAWRLARPDLYGALIGLAEANRTVLSLDVAGLRAMAEDAHRVVAHDPVGFDVADVVIEQRGRWVVETEQVAVAGALLDRFLGRIAAFPGTALPTPGQLRGLLVDEAEALAAQLTAQGDGPDWLGRLRERPAVVSALIERAAELL